MLLPGVISHATNIVEHPDTIADRIVRFAELVGRENVVASADCGFSSQATYNPEIHPSIVWAKFESLTEGARRATARLWASSGRAEAAGVVAGLRRRRWWRAPPGRRCGPG